MSRFLRKQSNQNWYLFQLQNRNLSTNQPTKLIILNKDFVKHDFISEELGINTAYLSAEQDFVTGIASNKTGNYTYYCSFHPEMRGTIEITQ